MSRNIREGLSYGFGPDNGEGEVKKEMLVTFTPKEKIHEWANTGIIEINPKWRDWVIPVTVNFAALTHMFRVDNIKCYGDIVDFHKYGVPSTAECQFIIGCGMDNFSAGMYAFHVNGFMSSYHLWYHRGINGPNVTLETDTTNAPAGIPPIPSPLNSANAKQSSSMTFDDMLGPHDKCSFSVELRVYPKHTDGFGTIWEYSASDMASVALEKVPCISIPVPAIRAPELSKPYTIAITRGKTLFFLRSKK